MSFVADPAASLSEGASESGTSERTGGQEPPATLLPPVAPPVATAPAPTLSGEYPGGTVAERVAERRRGSAKAGAAGAGRGTEQVTESPAVPGEGS